MTLSKKLKDKVCQELGIRSRQLRNRVAQEAVQSRISDRDVALLLLAYEQKIDITKPRYKVKPEKIAELDKYLSSQKIPIVAGVASGKGKGAGKPKPPPFKRFLKFQGKYPEIFYDRLENEINVAYNNPNLPNASLMLSRKLIENLVYNLLEYKFGKIGEYYRYYDTRWGGRALDFSGLIENLEATRSKYDADQQERITKFLSLVKPFRRDANSKVHKVMEYLESMKQLDKLKIPDMTQLLINLIDRVRSKT